MGFDLYLVPGSDFLEWNDEQWSAFYDQKPAPDPFQIARARYFGLVIDAIAHNLENDQLGSRYPFLARADQQDVPGWYNNELDQLSGEIESIRTALAALPVNRSTLVVYSEADYQDIAAGFRGKPPPNMYELCRYFIDGFATMIKKAQETGQGLFMSA